MRGSPRDHYVHVLAVLFQFTPLHERQHEPDEENPSAKYHFNSRLYMRGSSSGLKGERLKCYFNSRLYMRGSQSHNTLTSFRFNFNSRLYMRGSMLCLPVVMCEHVFQFTPLHERQREPMGQWVGCPNISIHAST